MSAQLTDVELRDTQRVPRQVEVMLIFDDGTKASVMLRLGAPVEHVLNQLHTFGQVIKRKHGIAA